MKRWYWLVAVVIIIILGIIFIPRLLNRDEPFTPDSMQQTSGPVSSESSSEKLYIGDPQAPVTLVEYGDFKCPTCNTFFRGAEVQIRQDYIDTGKAKIEFRNLPYINLDSRTAAEGAYCANAQDAFTAYHDAVFNYIWDEYYASGNYAKGESTDVFNTNSLSAVADQIGIDVNSFTNCLENRTYTGNVDADLKASEQDKVAGTPTIFLSNQKIVGAQPYQVYSVLIERELNQ